MSGTPFVPPRFIPVNSSGRPYPGSKLYFYRAGTTTLATVYTNSALTVPAANPLTANSAGMFDAVYLNPAAGHDYKAVLQNSSGAQLWSEDNIPSEITLTASSVGQALYPRTDEEITASVIPSLYQYAPGDVRRYGAVGNGSTDDSGAITTAISTGHPIIFERKTYACASVLTISASRVIEGNGATLKRTTDSDFVRFLNISGTNVTIRDLRIDGNRAALTPSEFKGGIFVTGSVVRLENVHCVNCVGDGFELRGTNIVLDGCSSDNAYRNGLSITDGYAVVVANSSFANTNGTAPECGIDVEPDLAASDCYNIHFTNCYASGNVSHGAQVLLSDTPTGVQRDIHFTDCVFEGNTGTGITVSRAINTRIVNCDVRGNTAGGIYFSKDASDVQIVGGQVRLNGGRGISLVMDSGKTAKDIAIDGVSIKDNSASSAGTNAGIRAAGPGSVTGLVITNCRIGNDGTSNQGHAITTGGTTVTKLRVVNNDLTGNATAATTLADEEASRFISGNAGYVGRKCGATGLIASGATVSHGLDLTPTVVLVTALDTGTTDVYASSIGASTFTVNYGGGGTHAFAWEAKVPYAN